MSTKKREHDGKDIVRYYFNRIQKNAGSLIKWIFIAFLTGFVVGGIVCIVVDIFVSNWLDDLIDKIAK